MSTLYAHLTPEPYLSTITHVEIRTRHNRLRRPLSVTIIGILILMQGLMFALLASLTLAIGSNAVLHLLPAEAAAELPVVTLRGLLLAAGAIVMGVAGLVSGVGVLRLRQWGWLLAMIAQGINLATELIDYTRGEANYINMLVSVVIVLYLNQRDIQRSFSIAQHHNDPVGNLTAEEDQAAKEEVQREVVGTR